ncbi:MAG TPA: hypothetical protein VML93_21270, partial [Mycobacterium sp.]|nr:hypothetical protein [Mycobacterium sp.]
MMCGADSIDDVNVLRAGATPWVFAEVYARSTVGILLREFSFGHANQLAAVAASMSLVDRSIPVRERVGVRCQRSVRVPSCLGRKCMWFRRLGDEHALSGAELSRTNMEDHHDDLSRS